MDPDIKQAIADLEALVNAPKSLTDMQPHERMLADALGRTALNLYLTDDDLLAALPRILAFFVRKMADRNGHL
jgi:hypothetical protein